MPVCVVIIDISVVVLPISSTGVIRRVYVNAVDLTFVEIQQHLQNVKVLAVDDRVKP